MFCLVFNIPFILLIVVVGWYVWLYTSKWAALFEKIPGPTPWPIVGNTLEVFQGHKGRSLDFISLINSLSSLNCF
jgi:hypothetical protein